MTKVTFENATIRDVISKASRVAPSKAGSAFDKAAGVLIEIDTAAQQIVVKATNTEIFYMEIADFVEVEGVSTKWRMSSSLLDGICSKLPISSGKTVTFDDEVGHSVRIQSGRMRATLRLMDASYFPEWDAFDSSEMETVENFAASIQMVQWAASRSGEPPLTGVHFDGSMVVATDRFKIAIAPCKATPLYKPITVPAGIFTPLMKSLSDVQLGLSDNQLLVQPDPSIQIRAVMYGHDFPNVERVIKNLGTTASATFRKNALLEIIERAMVMAQRERSPLLKVIIGQEEIAVMMSDKEMGLLGDVIEVPGHANHERVTIGFTPENLIGALSSSPNDEVTLHYRPDNVQLPIKVDGGSGYEAIVMPRKEMEEQ